MNENNTLNPTPAQPDQNEQQPPQSDAANTGTYGVEPAATETEKPALSVESAGPEEQATPVLQAPAGDTAGPTAVKVGDKPGKQHKALLAVSMLVLGILIGGGTVFGAASMFLKPANTVQPQVQEKEQTAVELAVPEGATVISECAKGRGKQYVLPEDIPTGPVYNVWNGKVTSVEYMIGRDELLTEKKDFIDLALKNASYDHVNIGLLSQGHSGFPEPHYHVDIFTIPHSEASAITCQ